MTYDRITWLPDVLRKVGITVVEHDGWRTRGLSTARPFSPKTLVWHHDASGQGDSPGVPAYMIRNYESAGAQLWVDRQGRWHIIASGRAAHAGATLPGMPTNETSIGIETDHTTGEDWPPALLASLRKGSAAILNHWGQVGTGLHFHKTICDPPGRKVDPAGLDLRNERSVVAGLQTDLKRGTVDVRPERLTKFRNRFLEDRIIDLNLLDAQIRAGKPLKWAAAAKACKWTCINATKAFLRIVG